MKRPNPRLLARVLPSVLACLLTGVVAAGPAHADEEGISGRIVQLRINTPGSDQHPLFHGSITLDVVGTGSQIEYRWGGSSCPGVKLTDHQIDLLMTAFVQRTHVQVIPKYTKGTGARCLVGFVLTTTP